jgi:hypothetical protein
MNLGRSGLEPPAAVGSVTGSLLDPASAAKDARSVGAARIRPLDLDLLRLSYVCRANTLLQDLPERSLVLSSIHGFFDASPDRASVERFSLSALIDRGRARATCEADEVTAARGEA